MPVNVGEVEAVLAARDTMSPTMVQAAEKVAILTNQLGTLGVASVQAFNNINAQLSLAEANFRALSGTTTTASNEITQATERSRLAWVRLAEAAQSSSAGITAASRASREATVGLRESGDAAEVSADKLSQMDKMATRMIERLAILYSLRFGYDFVKDLFTSADALVRVSGQSDITLGKLQELQFGSDKTGIEFTKVTGAVDGFDKKLGEVKLSTADALGKIGLSFDQIFAMSPDERINAVFEAISKLPDATQRAAVESELFGTNGIDPLIMKFASLSKEARENGHVLEDETVKSLSNTAQAYRDFLNGLKIIATGIVMEGGRIAEALATPFFGGSNFQKDAQGNLHQEPNWWQMVKDLGPSGLFRIAMGDYGALDTVGLSGDELRSRGLRIDDKGRVVPDINVNAPGYGTNGTTNWNTYGSDWWYDAQGQSTNKSNKPGPAMGWDYIDQLDKADAALNNLTKDQWAQIGVLYQSNELNAESASHIGLTTVQWRELQAVVKDWNKEAIEATRSAKEWGKVQTDLAPLFEAMAEGGTNYRTVINGIDGSVVEVAEDLLRMGASAKDVQVEYGLTGSQVRALQKDIAEQAKEAREAEVANRKLADSLVRVESTRFGVDETSMRALQRSGRTDEVASQRVFADDARALEEMRKLEDEYNIEVMRGYATQTDFKIAEIEKWANNEKVKYKDAEGWIRTEYYDAIEQVAQQKIQNIIHASDPLWVAWHNLNEDMRNDWAATWEQALKGEGSFTDAAMAPFDHLRDGFTKMLAGMLADWEQQLLGPMLGQMQNALGRIFGMPSTGSGYSPGGPTFGTVASMAGMYVNGRWVGGATNTYYSPGDMEEGGTLPSTSSTGYIGAITGGQSGYGFRRPGTTRATVAAGVIGGVAQGMQGHAGGLNAQGNPESFADTMNSSMGWGDTSTYVMAASTFGISLGVQAMIGTIKYLFRDRTFEDIARDAGKDFGTHFATSTMEAIKADVEEKGQRTVVAELGHLPEIIQDAGGLNSGNLSRFEAQFRNVFSDLAQRWLDVGAATQIVDGNFDTFIKAATDGLGRIDDQMREIIQLDEQYGTHSKAIEAWKSVQAGNVASGVNAVVAAQPTEWYGQIGSRVAKSTDDITAIIDKMSERDRNDLKSQYDLAKSTGFTGDLASFYVKQQTDQGRTSPQIQEYNEARRIQHGQAVGSKDELEDIGHQLMGSYALSVATGKSPTEAIDELKDGLSALTKMYKDLGIESDDAGVRELLRQNQIQQGSHNLVMGIQGLMHEMVGMDNLNIETTDKFREQERTGLNMYTRLQYAVSQTGGDTRDALLPMQDFLHAAADEAKKLGVPLDANLQIMIDQSKMYGIWKDNMDKVKDPMQQAIETLTQKIQKLIDTLRGTPDELPDPYRNWQPPPGTGTTGPPETQTPGNDNQSYAAAIPGQSTITASRLTGGDLPRSQFPLPGGPWTTPPNDGGGLRPRPNIPAPVYVTIAPTIPNGDTFSAQRVIQYVHDDLVDNGAIYQDVQIISNREIAKAQ